jgi:S1-C subfamily serine protease
VLAVGNPFAFSQTVTLGIVSTVSRTDPQLMTYSDFIQTDAAINPGNSGGALVNDRGELVGINTMIYSQTGGYQGIGFAIPANVARRIMDALITDGEILRGSIGNLTYRPVDSETARRLGLPQARGARILQMYRNEPAFAAGLRPDDIIVTVNGRAVAEPGQLMRLVADSPIGTNLTVDAVRLTRSGPREFSVSVPVVQMRPPPRRY